MSLFSLSKKGIALILVLLMIAAPLLAQQEMSEYLQGKMDGEREAKGNNMWFLAGCLLGGVGIIIAYVMEPDVPTQQLVGKSPEYVQGYTEGYKKKAQTKNAMSALYGCLALGVAYIILYAAVLAEASTID